MHYLELLALAGVATAQYKGFNYGSTTNDGTVRVQQDFENEFNRAMNLQGQPGFTAARLYTMIQGNTADTVTSAIPAAINSKTSLLLGLWASAGQASFSNELTALKNAIAQYGTSFTDLIAGISVGSEDLYRVSPTGIENMSGVGSTPDELVSYIGQVRDVIRGTAAAGAQIGHVDTWTAWVNGSNAAVINAVDWLGMDGYPYYQTTQSNGIENAETLFFDSYNATVGVAGGKEVWVTETGWPYQGPTANLAVASIQNAETYWQQVACRLLGNVNTFWFTLQDPKASTSDISFGLIGNDLNGAPLYDLTCSNGNTLSSSSTVAPSSSSTAASPTNPTTSATATSPTIVTSPGPEATTSASAAQSSVTYACNPAHAYPTGQVCTEINGSLTLITTTGASAYPTGGSPPASQSKTEPGTTLITLTSGSSTTEAATQTSQPAPVVPGPTSGKNCPANLDGLYEYPHLIVPVDSANPSQAYGTSYNGKVTPTISSIFNFDIPASDAGKTCSLVFLFPSQKDLQTSSYTFNGQGGIKVTELKSPATEQTTYQNQPAAGGLTQEIASVAPGNEYLVFSHECGAGQRVAFEFSSIGGLDLTYFQDYNPSPIGAYITVC